MKTIYGIISAVLFLCVFQVSSAFARQIDCPTDQVRTEVVTALPSPWWQTHQVGNLQNTRIAEIGGETTLICEYQAYGTNVSVMRTPPAQFQNCTANSDGFQCRRIAVASVTYRTGPLDIPQTWRADLDSGAVGSGTADIWFQAATATERYVTPVNGARIGIYDGGGGIAKQDCATTPKSTNRIDIVDLPVGTYVCVRTSDSRHAVFRVNTAVGPSPGTLKIGFTTWQ
jgi:hypothetical protein